MGNYGCLLSARQETGANDLISGLRWSRITAATNPKVRVLSLQVVKIAQTAFADWVQPSKRGPERVIINGVRHVSVRPIPKTLRATVAF